VAGEGGLGRMVERDGDIRRVGSSMMESRKRLETLIMRAEIVITKWVNRRDSLRSSRGGQSVEEYIIGTVKRDWDVEWSSMVNRRMVLETLKKRAEIVITKWVNRRDSLRSSRGGQSVEEYIIGKVRMLEGGWDIRSSEIIRATNMGLKRVWR
jgi:hypothetical protein